MEGLVLTDGGFRAALVTDDAGSYRRYSLYSHSDNVRDAVRFSKAARLFVYRKHKSLQSRCLRALSWSKLAHYFQTTSPFVIPISALEWPTVIYENYELHLSSMSGNALGARLRAWQGGIRPILEFLRAVEELIPWRVDVRLGKAFRHIREEPPISAFHSGSPSLASDPDIIRLYAVLPKRTTAELI